MTKPKLKLFDDMGLCLSDGAMVWGHRHGHLRWAPDWVKSLICTLWNKTHCAIAGHDTFGLEAYTKHVIPGSPVCGYCCARLKVEGRYPTPEEIKSHNDLCDKSWAEADTKWRLENPEEAAEHDRQQVEFEKKFPDIDGASKQQSSWADKLVDGGDDANAEL